MDTLMSILRGTIGMIFFLGVCYLLSSDRKNIKWKVVWVGTSMQIVLAFAILKIPVVRMVLMALPVFCSGT